MPTEEAACSTEPCKKSKIQDVNSVLNSKFNTIINIGGGLVWRFAL